MSELMERGCWEEGRVGEGEQEDVRQMERGGSAGRERERKKETERGKVCV